MGNKNLVVYVPKDISHNFINAYIGKLNFFFDLKNKQKENCYVLFDKVTEVDLLSILLTYKFLEFSVRNNCFNDPHLSLNPEMKKQIKRFGFDGLITDLMRGKDAKDEYEKLKIEVKDDFLIAPIGLIRSDNFNKDAIKNKYLPVIMNYYKDKAISDMIFQVFSEILHNFWSHAVTDTLSIIVVHGNQSKIQIACADTGNGLVDTLRSEFINKNDEQIIKKSVERGVTSKPNTNHMGFGLWFVNEIITKTNGKFEIFSHKGYYRNLGGRISTVKSYYWMGTIINIELPLIKPVTIADIEPMLGRNLKINFK